MHRSNIVMSLLIIALVSTVCTGLRAAPTAADKSFNTATQFITLHNEDQAVDELKHFLEAFPTDSRFARAAFLLGSCYQTLGKLDAALDSYARVPSRALGDTPDEIELRARTHYQIALCHYAKQDWAKAEQYFNNFLQLSGKVDVSRSENVAKSWKGIIVNARYRRAECLYQLNRKEDALQEYARVLETDRADPLAAWACYMVGYLHLTRADYSKAITTFEQLGKEYATSEVAGEASLELGAAYLGRARSATDPAQRQSDYQKATDLLEKALQAKNIPPSSQKQAAISLAEACYETGNLPGSETAYIRALGLLNTDEPDSLLTWQTFLQHAHVLYNMKKYPEAKKEYGRIVEHYTRPNAGKLPDVATEALFWLANSSYQLGTVSKSADDYASAVKALKQFLDLAEKDEKAPQAALLLGYCYEDMADYLGDKIAGKEAVNVYSMILKKWRDSEVAPKARSGIARQSRSLTSTELDNLMKLFPSGEAAWDLAVQLAYKKYADGNFAGAFDAAKKVLDGKPADRVKAQAAYLAGASQFKLEHPELAAPYYQQVLAAAPTGELAPFARRALVQAYLANRDYANASKAAEELVASPPQAGTAAEAATEKAERLMFLASACYGNKQLDKAKTAYRQIYTDFATSTLAPTALIYFAQLAENDDLNGAIAAYQQFLKTYPTHASVPDVYLALGADQASLHQYEDAIATYQKVPADHKLADQAAYAIALAYKGMKKEDAANAQFQLVTTKYPKSSYAVDSWYRLGEFLMSATQKKYTEAGQAFRASLRLAEELKLEADAAQTSLTYFNLASCAYFDGQYPQAVEAFGKVADLFPTSDYAPPSLFWKGQAAEKQGGDAAQKIAHDAYQKYLVANPTGEFAADAAVGIGRASVAGRQYKVARTELQNAMDICNGLERNTNATLANRAKIIQGEIQYLVAQTFYAEKDYKTAGKEFAAVSMFKYEPWYSLSYLQIARCNAAQGDKEGALNTLKLLQRTLPESDGARQVPTVARELGLTL